MLKCMDSCGDGWGANKPITNKESCQGFAKLLMEYKLQASSLWNGFKSRGYFAIVKVLRTSRPVVISIKDQ